MKKSEKKAKTREKAPGLSPWKRILDFGRPLAIEALEERVVPALLTVGVNEYLAFNISTIATEFGVIANAGDSPIQVDITDGGGAGVVDTLNGINLIGAADQNIAIITNFGHGGPTLTNTAIKFDISDASLGANVTANLQVITGQSFSDADGGAPGALRLTIGGLLNFNPAIAANTSPPDGLLPDGFNETTAPAGNSGGINAITGNTAGHTVNLTPLASNPTLAGLPAIGATSPVGVTDGFINSINISGNVNANVSADNSIGPTTINGNIANNVTIDADADNDGNGALGNVSVGGNVGNGVTFSASDGVGTVGVTGTVGTGVTIQAHDVAGGTTNVANIGSMTFGGNVGGLTLDNAGADATSTIGTITSSDGSLVLNNIQSAGNVGLISSTDSTSNAAADGNISLDQAAIAGNMAGIESAIGDVSLATAANVAITGNLTGQIKSGGALALGVDTTDDNITIGGSSLVVGTTLAATNGGDVGTGLNAGAAAVVMTGVGASFAANRVVPGTVDIIGGNVRYRFDRTTGNFALLTAGTFDGTGPGTALADILLDSADTPTSDFSLTTVNATTLADVVIPTDIVLVDSGVGVFGDGAAIGSNGTPGSPGSPDLNRILIEGSVDATATPTGADIGTAAERLGDINLIQIEGTITGSVAIHADSLQGFSFGGGTAPDFTDIVTTPLINRTTPFNITPGTEGGTAIFLFTTNAADPFAESIAVTDTAGGGIATVNIASLEIAPLVGATVGNITITGGIDLLEINDANTADTLGTVTTPFTVGTIRSNAAIGAIEIEGSVGAISTDDGSDTTSAAGIGTVTIGYEAAPGGVIGTATSATTTTAAVSFAFLGGPAIITAGVTTRPFDGSNITSISVDGSLVAVQLTGSVGNIETVDQAPGTAGTASDLGSVLAEDDFTGSVVVGRFAGPGAIVPFPATPTFSDLTTVGLGAATTSDLTGSLVAGFDGSGAFTNAAGVIETAGTVGDGVVDFFPRGDSITSAGDMAVDIISHGGTVGPPSVGIFSSIDITGFDATDVTANLARLTAVGLAGFTAILPDPETFNSLATGLATEAPGGSLTGAVISLGGDMASTIVVANDITAPIVADNSGLAGDTGGITGTIVAGIDGSGSITSTAAIIASDLISSPFIAAANAINAPIISGFENVGGSEAIGRDGDITGITVLAGNGIGDGTLITLGAAAPIPTQLQGAQIRSGTLIAGSLPGADGILGTADDTTVDWVVGSASIEGTSDITPTLIRTGLGSDFTLGGANTVGDIRGNILATGDITGTIGAGADAGGFIEADIRAGRDGSGNLGVAAALAITADGRIGATNGSNQFTAGGDIGGPGGAVTITAGVAAGLDQTAPDNVGDVNVDIIAGIDGAGQDDLSTTTITAANNVGVNPLVAGTRNVIRASGAITTVTIAAGTAASQPGGNVFADIIAGFTDNTATTRSTGGIAGGITGLIVTAEDDVGAADGSSQIIAADTITGIIVDAGGGTPLGGALGTAGNLASVGGNVLLNVIAGADGTGSLGTTGVVAGTVDRISADNNIGLGPEGTNTIRAANNIEGLLILAGNANSSGVEPESHNVFTNVLAGFQSNVVDGLEDVSATGVMNSVTIAADDNIGSAGQDNTGGLVLEGRNIGTGGLILAAGNITNLNVVAGGGITGNAANLHGSILINIASVRGTLTGDNPGIAGTQTSTIAADDSIGEGDEGTNLISFAAIGADNAVANTATQAVPGGPDFAGFDVVINAGNAVHATSPNPAEGDTPSNILVDIIARSGSILDTLISADDNIGDADQAGDPFDPLTQGVIRARDNIGVGDPAPGVVNTSGSVVIQAGSGTQGRSDSLGGNIFVNIIAGFDGTGSIDPTVIEADDDIGVAESGNIIAAADSIGVRNFVANTDAFVFVNAGNNADPGTMGGFDVAITAGNSASPGGNIFATIRAGSPDVLGQRGDISDTVISAQGNITEEIFAGRDILASAILAIWPDGTIADITAGDDIEGFAGEPVQIIADTQIGNPDEDNLLGSTIDIQAQDSIRGQVTIRAISGSIGDILVETDVDANPADADGVGILGDVGTGVTIQAMFDIGDITVEQGNIAGVVSITTDQGHGGSIGDILVSHGGINATIVNPTAAGLPGIQIIADSSISSITIGELGLPDSVNDIAATADDIVIQARTGGIGDIFVASDISAAAGTFINFITAGEGFGQVAVGGNLGIGTEQLLAAGLAGGDVNFTSTLGGGMLGLFVGGNILATPAAAVGTGVDILLDGVLVNVEDPLLGLAFGSILVGGSLAGGLPAPAAGIFGTVNIQAASMGDVVVGINGPGNINPGAAGGAINIRANAAQGGIANVTVRNAIGGAGTVNITSEDAAIGNVVAGSLGAGATDRLDNDLDGLIDEVGEVDFVNITAAEGIGDVVALGSGIGPNVVLQVTRSVNFAGAATRIGDVIAHGNLAVTIAAFDGSLGDLVSLNGTVILNGIGEIGGDVGDIFASEGIVGPLRTENGSIGLDGDIGTNDTSLNNGQGLNSTDALGRLRPEGAPEDGITSELGSIAAFLRAGNSIGRVEAGGNISGSFIAQGGDIVSIESLAGDIGGPTAGSDGFDNDGDGMVDESATDGIDNNGNGLIDEAAEAADEAGATIFAAGNIGSFAGAIDEVDNDGDGQVDEADEATGVRADNFIHDNVTITAGGRIGVVEARIIGFSQVTTLRRDIVNNDTDGFLDDNDILLLDNDGIFDFANDRLVFDDINGDGIVIITPAVAAFLSSPAGSGFLSDGFLSVAEVNTILQSALGATIRGPQDLVTDISDVLVNDEGGATDGIDNDGDGLIDEAGEVDADGIFDFFDDTILIGDGVNPGGTGADGVVNLSAAMAAFLANNPTVLDANPGLSGAPANINVAEMRQIIASTATITDPRQFGEVRVRDVDDVIDIPNATGGGVLFIIAEGADDGDEGIPAIGRIRATTDITTDVFIDATNGGIGSIEAGGVLGSVSSDTEDGLANAREGAGNNLAQAEIHAATDIGTILGGRGITNLKITVQSAGGLDLSLINNGEDDDGDGLIDEVDEAFFGGDLGVGQEGGIIANTGDISNVDIQTGGSIGHTFAGTGSIRDVSFRAAGDTIIGGIGHISAFEDISDSEFRAAGLIGDVRTGLGDINNVTLRAGSEIGSVNAVQGEISDIDLRSGRGVPGGIHAFGDITGRVFVAGPIGGLDGEQIRSDFGTVDVEIAFFLIGGTSFTTTINGVQATFTLDSTEDTEVFIRTDDGVDIQVNQSAADTVLSITTVGSSLLTIDSLTVNGDFGGLQASGEGTPAQVNINTATITGDITDEFRVRGFLNNLEAGSITGLVETTIPDGQTFSFDVAGIAESISVDGGRIRVAIGDAIEDPEGVNQNVGQVDAADITVVGLTPGEDTLTVNSTVSLDDVEGEIGSTLVLTTTDDIVGDVELSGGDVQIKTGGDLTGTITVTGGNLTLDIGEDIESSAEVEVRGGSADITVGGDIRTEDIRADKGLDVEAGGEIPTDTETIQGGQQFEFTNSEGLTQTINLRGSSRTVAADVTIVFGTVRDILIRGTGGLVLSSTLEGGAPAGAEADLGDIQVQTGARIAIRRLDIDGDVGDIQNTNVRGTIQRVDVSGDAGDIVADGTVSRVTVEGDAESIRSRSQDVRDVSVRGDVKLISAARDVRDVTGGGDIDEIRAGRNARNIFTTGRIQILTAGRDIINVGSSGDFLFPPRAGRRIRNVFQRA